MKYIRKLSPPPEFFINDTIALTIWDDYYSDKKRKLKKYILDNEQFWLCCYCEKKVTLDGGASHVEHIDSRELNPPLTFDYKNLVVSCQGDTYNDIDFNKSKNTCGHKKPNDFDKNLFLNPTIETDIQDYFTYEDNGIMKPSDKDKGKAKYTITLLNLNGDNNLLAEARKKVLIQLRNSIKNLNLSNDEKKNKIRLLLSKNDREYISFLRYRFYFLIQDKVE